MKEKVLLAFSGGLDTSFCAKYLAEEKGYEVHTAVANTGGFDEAELERIAQRAKDLGVASHVTLDITKEYYEKSIRYMVYGNVLRNGTYPISVSSVRQTNRCGLCGARQHRCRKRPGAFRPDVRDTCAGHQNPDADTRHGAHAGI